jgi:hypothetical protein
MCPAVGSVFDAIGTGASSLSNQRWPCFEAIEPNRLLAVTDHALIESRIGRHQKTPIDLFQHSCGVLQKLGCLERVRKNDINLILIHIAVKFDHALLRHQHQRVADPRTDTLRQFRHAIVKQSSLCIAKRRCAHQIPP